MRNSSRNPSGSVLIAALVTTFTLALAPAAFGDDWARDSAATAAAQELDPAIRTAIVVARTAAVPVTPPVVASTSVTGGDEFAWGAAALGLGAGVAAMCVLLGCVTLVRSNGRLRSV